MMYVCCIDYGKIHSHVWQNSFVEDLMEHTKFEGHLTTNEDEYQQSKLSLG